MAVVLDDALRAHAAGLCVLPPREDGSKAPIGEWKQFEGRRPTEDEIRRWYSPHRNGLGFVCGQISGGLELFEFEGRAVEAGLHAQFTEACEAAGLGDLLDRIATGYMESTPSGGVHLLYRCAVTKTEKLARRPGAAVEGRPTIEVLIETKGEGGYVIVAPTAGPVHPTGMEWALIHGGVDRIVSIEPHEREALHSVARSFDEMPRPVAHEEHIRHVVPDVAEDKPGDAYNRQARWVDILEPHGWRRVFQRGKTVHWCRPGKDAGTSATTGHGDGDYLYVFSSSTMFDSEHAYSKFAAYAILNHGGDYSAAARALVTEGYGEQAPKQATKPVEEPPWLDAVEDDYVAEWEPPTEERPVPVVVVQEKPLPDDLFRRYPASELVLMDRTFRWLVRRLLVEPTYGQIAGELKSLKTYFNLMVVCGVASGSPILDIFTPERAAPVLMYVGEGGRVPITRRLERVAEAMGLDLGSLPIEVSFDVAPVQSPVFVESLDRDLREVQPGLVSIDPLYAYHGTQTKASDLHAEGALLSGLSSRVGEGGASLLVVNHFNQTGVGGGLKRITMAGSGEWVDSWLLLSHRSPPNVAAGEFQLLLEVGSRQWGGTSWDVDLNIGRFDADSGVHDGVVQWTVRRHEGGTSDRSAVVDLVAQRPGEMVKEELAKALGGTLTGSRALVFEAERSGLIVPRLVPRQRSDGRPYKAWVYYPADATRTSFVGEPTQETEQED